jgi:hypothetical protein
LQQFYRPYATASLPNRHQSGKLKIAKSGWHLSYLSKKLQKVGGTFDTFEKWVAPLIPFQKVGGTFDTFDTFDTFRQ